MNGVRRNQSDDNFLRIFPTLPQFKMADVDVKWSIYLMHRYFFILLLCILCIHRIEIHNTFILVYMVAIKWPCSAGAAGRTEYFILGFSSFQSWLELSM